MSDNVVYFAGRRRWGANFAVSDRIVFKPRMSHAQTCCSLQSGILPLDHCDLCGG